MNNFEMLVNAGIRTHSIAKILSLTDDEVDIRRDEYERALSDAEKYYNEVERPKVQQAIKEMIEEVPKEERDQMRYAYLEEELPKAKQEFLEACVAFAKRKDKTFKLHDEQNLDRLRKRLLKLGMDLKICVGKAEGISPEKIAQAQSYPLTELIKSTRGMAKCPFHNDKTPSMDIRKNFYFCYGCGAHGNSIDMVMKTQNLSFKEAIQRLT